MRRCILVLFVAALVTPAIPQTFPAARGSWSRAANELSARRLSGQATLLLDGRVAVSGGQTAVIELFDPATSAFSPGPSDLKERRKFAAIRLLDGRVLFTGGESFDASCSIYDPVAGTVVSTGSLNKGRQNHVATLLPNGKVLVTGGYMQWDGVGPRNLCEIYDPAAGVWSLAGSLVSARADHNATLLPDGKVMLAGGQSGPGNTELYDPVTMTSATQRTFTGRRIETATLPDGRIFFLNDDGSYVDAGLYVPATGTFEGGGGWAVLPGLPSYAAIGALQDGRVIVAGELRTDVCTGLHCTVIAAPIVPRRSPEGVMLGDGRFLVVGGTSSRVAELFDPKARGPVRGDLDHDGRSDIVWHHSATKRTVLWLMDGVHASGSPLPSYPESGHDWRLEALVDVDGGAVMDGLWRDYTPGTYDLRWRPGPNIQHGATGGDQLPSQTLDWSIAACGDFTGDGIEDLLWRRTDGAAEVWDMDLFYPMERAIRLRALIDDPAFVIAAADDFDGDGSTDVLWHHLGRGENYIWFMQRGYAVRAGHTAPVTDMNYSVAGSGDFDGDGKADIVWRSGLGPTRIWFMNGVTIVNDFAVPAPGAGWNVAVIGDFDGDGKSDIFWRNPSTGENAVTLFDGWNVKTASSLPPVTESGWTTLNP